MKRYILKMLALSLLVTAVISGCSVQTREYNKRSSRYDRHHHDDRRNDHRNDRGGERYNRHY